METALLRIDIENLALAFGKGGAVLQHLSVGEGCRNQCRHVECLAALRLACGRTEVSECGDGRVVDPDNLRRCLEGLIGEYERVVQELVQHVLVDAVLVKQYLFFIHSVTVLEVCPLHT